MKNPTFVTTPSPSVAETVKVKAVGPENAVPFVGLRMVALGGRLIDATVTVPVCSG